LLVDDVAARDLVFGHQLGAKAQKPPVTVAASHRAMSADIARIGCSAMQSNC
jgi:hypothetical protein